MARMQAHYRDSVVKDLVLKPAEKWSDVTAKWKDAGTLALAYTLEGAAKTLDLALTADDWKALVDKYKALGATVIGVSADNIDRELLAAGGELGVRPLGSSDLAQARSRRVRRRRGSRRASDPERGVGDDGARRNLACSAGAAHDPGLPGRQLRAAADQHRHVLPPAVRRGVPERVVAAPPRQQGIEPDRIDHRTGQDMGADFGTLFDQANAEVGIDLLEPDRCRKPGRTTSDDHDVEFHGFARG